MESENYKDPKKTLQKLTEMGYKPVTIIDPGVKKKMATMFTRRELRTAILPSQQRMSFM